MSQLFISALPTTSHPTPTPKQFGLSAAELRAKRATAKALRAEQERAREVDEVVRRIEGHLASGRVPWDSESSIAREIFFNERELRRESLLRLSELYDHLELKCYDIAKSYRPLIEAARLESAGSAARRRAKREAKESRRQQRRSTPQAA